MKNLTKITILSIFLFVFAGNAQAQCTPDNSTPDWSIDPYQLSRATVNTPYSQVLKFKAGTDTSSIVLGQTVNVKIDSMKITGVKGLPAGFTYQCHNPLCRVLGGQAGCAVVSGQSAVKGSYPLTVYVSVWGKAQLIVPFPISSSDSVTRYTLHVDFQTGVSEITEGAEMKLLPNPARDRVRITVEGPVKSKKTIVISDISGREVYHGEPASNEVEVDLAAWKSGLYFVTMDDGTHQLRKKLMVR